MRKIFQVLCVMLLIVSILPKATMATAVKHDFQHVNELSTWLWDTARIVSESEEVIHNLVNEGVSDLYLQVNATIETAYYQQFISKASSNGIRVHALDGAPSWVAGQKGINEQQVFTDWLVNYQSVVSSDERFVGIHLDVEPYEHPNYEKNPNNYFKNYQTMIVQFEQIANTMGLEFGIDIPFWYYGVTYNNIYGKGNIAEFLSQHVKNISIMAYRDSANGSNGHDGINQIASAQMDLFEKYNVKGTIAVETGRLTDDSQYVTFYEEDKEYFYEQLDAVYQNYKNHPAFNGIAIHHYGSWMDMKAPKIPLSTWLWDTAKIVSEPDIVISNLVQHDVSDVYLQINEKVELPYYQYFINKAATNGIQVHALDGAPTWIAGQKGISQQEAFLEWLVNYQKAASPSERFVGIHLDVEPYQHPKYEERVNNFFKNYQAMVVTFREHADSMGMEFGLDIPFWYYGVMYNNVYGKGNIAEFLSNHVENIAIMAYRDSANGSNGNDGIIAISAAQMKIFEQHNVKTTIAVETGKLNDESKYLTFYEEGKDYLTSEVNKVYEHYKDHPAFNGMAIHYYDSWMDLK
ncbi:hypothetical protein [Sporosarcina sp. PTS2304]|uniref:hypothetical protein n=1 Tax=Sporosarcina sp. PTS2304 TaxID=2283194 RepID=UPI0013B38E6E|nr:hypothetical protein [Sporosarcina sp. PTS2304]